jgi:hypothetical protein
MEALQFAVRYESSLLHINNLLNRF